MFSLVIPFYNGDWQKVTRTLPALLCESASRRVSEIILAHNGDNIPTDLAEYLESLKPFLNVIVCHTPNKGIGAGYREGLKHATQPWVVFSASDLPFGWSDIEAFVNAGLPRFAIGSKAHPASKMGKRAKQRVIVTWLFYCYRRVLIGSETPKDSQGTLIIERELARQLMSRAWLNDYLISLELATLALDSDVKVIEIPVTLANELGPSAVSVWTDGIKMGIEVLRLKGRLKKKKAAPVTDAALNQITD